MSKLILRSIKRASAKAKPEKSREYLDTIMKVPGVYALLLEPVLNEEDGIIDFVVLLVSHSIEELEQVSDPVGKRLKVTFSSSSQWFESAKLAWDTGQLIHQDIYFYKKGQPSWFRATFFKQDQWLVSTWESARPKARHLNEGSSIDFGNNGTAPSEKKSDTVIEQVKTNNKSLRDLIETERMTVQVHTIRTIIHEIRNPLTSIALANQLLTEVNNDENDQGLSIATLTNIIFQNSRKIEDHLRQLLQAKPDEDLTLLPTDLCQVVESALQKAENRLFLSRVKVCRNFKPGNLIKGNPAKLGTAFLNIIINAIEAIDHENGHLWVSIYPSENDVKIIFRDNGIGMTPEVIQRIFEPHFSKKKNGLGIGLANVKEILDLHEASVKVSSEPGKGASFTVLFRKLPPPLLSKSKPSQYEIDF